MGQIHKVIGGIPVSRLTGFPIGTVWPVTEVGRSAYGGNLAAEVLILVSGVQVKECLY
jgi:hypothetical protein